MFCTFLGVRTPLGPRDVKVKAKKVLKMLQLLNDLQSCSGNLAIMVVSNIILQYYIELPNID